MTRGWQWFVAAVMALAMSGCAMRGPMVPRKKPVATPLALTTVLSWDAKDAVKGVSRVAVEVRANIVRESGWEMGARAGYAWRIEVLHERLQKWTPVLDEMFRYDRLLVGRLLPPVIEQVEESVVLASDSALTEVGRTYRITEPARLVIEAPNWRGMLRFDSTPPKPEEAMAPRDSAERAVWRDAVQEGFEAGVRQAEASMRSQLEGMTRRLVGMLRYRALLAMGVVSAPVVGSNVLPIVREGNELRIEERMREITQPVLFQAQEMWNAVVVPK